MIGEPNRELAFRFFAFDGDDGSGAIRGVAHALADERIGILFAEARGGAGARGPCPQDRAACAALHRRADGARAHRPDPRAASRAPPRPTGAARAASRGPVPRGGRRIPDHLAQFADLINTAVRCSVNFDHVQRRCRGNLFARVAFAARLRRRSLHAVQRLRQNPRRGSFPHAARAGKDVSVRNAIIFNCVLQSLCYVCLPNEVREGLRPPFACNDLVGHTFLAFSAHARKKSKPELRRYRASLLLLSFTSPLSRHSPAQVDRIALNERAFRFLIPIAAPSSRLVFGRVSTQVSPA